MIRGAAISLYRPVGETGRDQCRAGVPAAAVAPRRRRPVVVAEAGVLLRSLTECGQVTVTVADCTDLVADAARRHKTARGVGNSGGKIQETARPSPPAASKAASTDTIPGHRPFFRLLSSPAPTAYPPPSTPRRVPQAPTSTAALGRCLVGALLLGSFRKPDEMLGGSETTQIAVQGRGPIGQVLAVCTDGLVKGYVERPETDPPLRPDGKLNVGAAVGEGVLRVTRTSPRQREPTVGVVPLATGEIAEDIARYLVESEQVPSALGLGVQLDRDAAVTAAGGFLITVLPGAADETIAALEENLRLAPPVSELLSAGLSAKDVTRALLGGSDGLAFSEVGRVEPRYGPCDPEDLRNRMKRAVATLGSAEVRSILEEQGVIEARKPLFPRPPLFPHPTHPLTIPFTNRTTRLTAYTTGDV